MSNNRSLKRSLHAVARALYVLVTVVVVMLAVTSVFVGGH